MQCGSPFLSNLRLPVAGDCCRDSVVLIELSASPGVTSFLFGCGAEGGALKPDVRGGASPQPLAAAALRRQGALWPRRAPPPPGASATPAQHAHGPPP